ncbi:MAG TPA: hypothetical protein VIL74_01370 [Pyrinomonadaceae bacterium]|jgi:hypothetical protein
MLILTVCLSATAFRGQPASVEKISPNVTRISAVTDVKFSPSGKLTVIQTDAGFYYFPTARLDEVIAGFDDLSGSMWVEGEVKDFLPVSEKIVFAPRRGLYGLDARTGETQPIFQMTAKDEEEGNYLGDGEIIAVSENLILSGDGDWDMGLKKGNILRFDVGRGNVERAAQIPGMRYGWLSPNRRYVVYDHAGESVVQADLYDIERNVNYPVSKRFDFKRHFPKHKEALVRPLGWFGADKFAAIVDENRSAEFETKNSGDAVDTAAWLVLFDAARGKIVWKRQLNGIEPPVHLEQLSPTKAFFDGDNAGRYEVSLIDGALTELPRVEGTGFSFSPDKNRMAYFDERRVFVSSPNGADKKLAIEMPEKSVNRGVIDKSTSWINWSPDGERLLVFDDAQLWLVRL